MTRAERVIITNLTDIVTECGKTKSTQTHYICICPYCMETEQKTHWKLYIKKDYSVGFCFSCNSAFVSDKNKDKNEIKKLYPICLERDFSKKKNQYLDIQPIDLSVYDTAMDYLEEGVEYLSTRPDNQLSIDYENYGLKFTPNGVILPIYTFGHLEEIVFFQIRYFNTSLGNKYFMPTITEKPIAVVHKGITNTAWCVEGIFGAIALTRLFPQDTILAFLGKYLTDFHAWQLGAKQDWINEYIVFMDDTDLSKKFCQSLIDSKIYIESLSYVESDGRDPDELIQSGAYPIVTPYNRNKRNWKAPDFRQQNKY